MDLQVVFSELYSAHQKWYNIGLELKINPCDLDAIRVKNADDPDKCLHVLLSTWLESRDSIPTWRAIVNALKSPTVNFEQLSRQVEQKCSANVSHLVLPFVDNSQSQPQTQEVFRCHCGECNLLSFIENGCPQTSSNLYPYLLIHDISKYDREDLIQKLEDDTEKIIQCFADLLSNIGKSLKRRKIGVTELVKVALDLGTYKSGSNTVPILDNDRTKLEEAASIDHVFLVLQKHVSCFNYEILGHIVRHLGDSGDHQQFENYCLKLKTYCERRVFEVPPRVFSPCESGRRDCKLFVVVGTQKLFFTLADVKVAQRKVASLLGLRASTVKLMRIDIGCVILIFSIPLMLSDLFPLEPATHTKLKAYGYSLFVPCTPTEKMKTEDQTLNTHCLALKSVSVII